MNWGPDAQNPAPDWTMSAALDSVPRGREQLTEVTNLRAAIVAWQALDPADRASAVLMLDHPITVGGAQIDRFEGEGIAALAERMSD